MLTYNLDKTKSVPLYEQLYLAIKDAITSESLTANEKLPSKRSLSKQLSISVLTVENAYSQLQSEGFIYSLPQKGFYVSDLPEIKTYEENRKSVGKSGEQKRNSKQNSAVNNSDGTTVLKKEYFADFTSNATDPTSFPFTTWAKLSRKILSEEQELLMKNSPSNGLLELRTAIARYLSDFRGMDVDPDNMIIGAGTEAMFGILIYILGNKRKYACEDPGYEKIPKIFGANQVSFSRIPIDKKGVRTNVLEKEKVDVVHVTPSHHFPTGITMPISRRRELLSWANNNTAVSEKNSWRFNEESELDRYIIEDDYDSEFRHSGLPIPALYSIDTNDRVIYMNTFTKSLASTIRISYMILPEHLAREYHERLSFMACTVSTFEQLTLARFISEGYYEKHINRMRTASRKKRDMLLTAIRQSRLGAISEISEEGAGLHFLLKVQTKKSDDKIISKLDEMGVRISTVEPGCFMINYSSIPIDRIEEAVDRMVATFGRE